MEAQKKRGKQIMETTPLCKSKQGQFGNIILFGVVITILVFTSIITYVVLAQFTIASADVITEPEALQILTDGGNAWVLWDYGILFLTGGLFVGMILSAIFIRSHPAFAWIFIVVLMLELFMIPMMSNILYEFKENDAINDTVDVSTAFPIMNFIVEKLPLISAFAIIVFLIVFFGKPFERMGEAGGY